MELPQGPTGFEPTSVRLQAWVFAPSLPYWLLHYHLFWAGRWSGLVSPQPQSLGPRALSFAGCYQHRGSVLSVPAHTWPRAAALDLLFSPRILPRPRVRDVETETWSA